MRLNEALENKKLDLRIRDLIVSQGKVSQSELDKYIKNLEDDSDNLMETNPFARHRPAEDASTY